ncbi:MAG: hypothetical protein OHK0052_10080 [Anaerolineales bacterium]
MQAQPKHTARALLVLLLITLAVLRVTAATPPNRLYLPLVLQNYRPPGLVISEVLYDPLTAEPDTEWVELYNASTQTIFLENYKIGNAAPGETKQGMHLFPPGAQIAPGATLLIAHNGAAFFETYGILPDYEVRDSDPGIPTLAKYSAWATGTMEFVNTGDDVILLDSADKIVDSLSWGTSTWAFNPAAPKAAPGSTLERAPANRDRDSAADWAKQTNPSPGIPNLAQPTPGPTSTPSKTPTASKTAIPTETGTPTAGPSPTATPTATPFAANLLISEVLYDPIGAEPANEWIELFNPNDFSLPMSGLHLGDEESQGGGEGMYTFPSGAQIAANGTLLIANNGAAFRTVYGFAPDYEIQESDAAIPNLTRATQWASGSWNLGNTGDEVLLLDATFAQIDALSWGDSTFAFNPPAPDVPEGASLERFPPQQDTNSALDWRAQAQPSPGGLDFSTPTPTPTASATASPTPEPTATFTPAPTNTPMPTPTPVGYLLVSEVLYDPLGAEPASEWIELYNPAAQPIDLSVYKLGDEETQGGSEGMYIFPAGAVISPSQVIVVAYSGWVYSQTYGTLPDYELTETLPQVLNLTKYTAWSSGSLALGNTGDEVLLLGAADTVVDALSWGDSVWAFDPSAPDVAAGHSLERDLPWVDTNTAADWRDQPAPSPGTLNLAPLSLQQ